MFEAELQREHFTYRTPTAAGLPQGVTKTSKHKCLMFQDLIKHITNPPPQTRAISVCGENRQKISYLNTLNSNHLRPLKKYYQQVPPHNPANPLVRPQRGALETVLSGPRTGAR